LRRILFLCLLCATSTLSHAQGADWFYLQGDKDTVKLLWAPNEWLPEVQGFNVKRRVPGGTWKTLNSRPILPTYFPEDIDSRTNDPALREELRKFHQRVSTSEPPQALSAVLTEFADYSKYQGYSKYRARRDAVLGAYRQALLFGFAYQDANVPKGETYEYALYPVMSDGAERDLPVAARTWKWGGVPSLKIPFGKPTLVPNTVESKMRISWSVEHAVLERNLVRNVRVYYVNAEGEKTLWTRKSVDDVKYLHAINVDLTGLGERGAVSFSAVPIDYFDFEGTPSESISYDWDQYREAVRDPGPAVTNAPSPMPPAPPPPPRQMGTYSPVQITSMVDVSAYYPPEARRRGEQGAPVVRACVGPSGALSKEPQITSPSGFPDLDAAAIRVAKAMRYAAGLENGAPAPESCISFKVKFAQTNR
jgi:TonB family protein